METGVFLFFAALALASALVVVGHRDPVKSTISLVVTLCSLAVVFVLLEAPFIATLQVLVYAGAILVLFLFVLMLLNVRRESRAVRTWGSQRWAALGGGLLAVGVLTRLLVRGGAGRASVADGAAPTLRDLARELFSRHLLQFEIVGLLLLAAVVAASVLARRPPASDEEGR